MLNVSSIQRLGTEEDVPAMTYQRPLMDRPPYP